MSTEIQRSPELQAALDFAAKFTTDEHTQTLRRAVLELEEKLRSSECARDQHTTQYCAEAVAIQQRVAELENQRADQDAEIDDMNTRLEVAQTRIAELERELAEARAKLEWTRKCDAELGAAIASRNAEIVTLEQQLAAAYAKLCQLRELLGEKGVL